MKLTQFSGSQDDLNSLLARKRDLGTELRNEKEQLAERYPIPKHEPGTHFIRGPIPCDWLRGAMRCGGKSANLALALWWLAGIEGANPIQLTPRVLGYFEISPRAARRRLAEFEKAGLVKVDRRRGRSPRVFLLTLAPAADK